MALVHTAVRRVLQQDTVLLRATCLAAPSRVQINHRLGPWPLPASVFLAASRPLAQLFISGRITEHTVQVRVLLPALRAARAGLSCLSYCYEAKALTRAWDRSSMI